MWGFIYIGEKPFECEICKKTYRLSNTLADHVRIHTGKKPYSCDLCQKSFTHRSGLYSHYKTATHIERIKSKNTNIQITQFSFDETIKKEDIKEEVKEEDSVDDPSSMSYSCETYTNQEIKEEFRELNGEQSVEDSNLDTDNLVGCSEYVQ